MVEVESGDKILVKGKGENSYYGENKFSCDLTITPDGKVVGDYMCNFAQEGEEFESNNAILTPENYSEMVDLAKQC